jgi:PadR family transcriptional regulator PadR
VTSRREFSPQTLSVLAALCAEPSQWHHGYALATQTGLKSGTLYPILIRLSDRGLLEACWQDEPLPTADGLASARAALAEAAPAEAEPARAKARPGVSPRRGRGVAAPSVP